MSSLILTLAMFQMHLSHVPLQCHRLNETTTADLAAMRLFAGVPHHVIDERSFLAEIQATIRADIRFMTQMYAFHVPHQTALTAINTKTEPLN